MPEVMLKGCTPEPMMSYLKALGVLRLISEDPLSGDPNARGFWRNDVFVLSSKFDENGIVDFFVNHYCPTPIVVPWSGGDFFAVDWSAYATTYKKTPSASTVIEAFLTTSSARLVRYRVALNACKAALEHCGIDTTPTSAPSTLKARQAEFVKIKWSFIETLRATCDQPEVIEWIDAAAVTGVEKFAPLLGSGGGSDGNTNLADNFMQNLWEVLPDFDAQRQVTKGKTATSTGAVVGLRDSLFREAATFRVVGRTSSLFDSGAVGGPNATQGMERASLSNPWDIILGLEGTLSFATIAVKRLASSTNATAAFPFQFAASPTRGTRLAEKERVGREVWLPLWHRPCMNIELLNLLKEGRAEAGARKASNGVDMARAIVTLGIDRGVESFFRYAIVKGRVGGDNYNTAAAIGRFAVNERPLADRLRETDPWIDGFRGACSDDKAPARFTSALRAIDSAILGFCQYGGTVHFQSILIALGAAERELATAERFRKDKFLRPLVGLSNAWIAASAAPDNGEFEIALALSGVDDPTHAIGALRSNLESVSLWREARGALKAKWAEADHAVVWNTADLATNLAAVLDRRMMDGGRKGCADLPIDSPRAASLGSIAAFIHGEFDDRKIEDLLWGLLLIDQGGRLNTALRPTAREQSLDLPPIYALLKLLFLPRSLVATRAADGTTTWRLANTDEGGIRIRPEPAILSLLRAGRVGEAAAIAMRRLRASGLNPLPHRRSGGPSRDGEWNELRLTPREGKRLAASLLIPIYPNAVNALVQQATRAATFDEPNEPPTLTSVQQGN